MGNLWLSCGALPWSRASGLRSMEHFQAYLLKSNDVSINGINELLQLLQEEKRINVSATAARFILGCFYNFNFLEVGREVWVLT
jgi:hypothetical protein